MPRRSRYRIILTAALSAGVLCGPALNSRAQDKNNGATTAPPVTPRTASDESGTAPTASPKQSPKSKMHHKRHLAQSDTTPGENDESAPTPSASDVTPPESDSTISGRLAVRMKLGDGLRVWHPSRHQIGVSYAEGTDDSPSGSFKFEVDRAILRRYLTQIAPYIRRSPKDARPALIDQDPTGEQPPVRIIPERDGAVLNIDAAVDAVAASIEKDPSMLHIVLPIKIKPAEVTADDLKGIDARIGYFVTRFNPDDVGRTETVRRAIELVDAHVLEPNATFSLNDVVGERTAARGFGIGHVFVDGQMKKEVGGGMCQVATTLFNAAMLADLKIVERHQHVRTIPYADPGRDATVYFGEKDFKFENDTSAPIYIAYKTTYSHAIVALYGMATPGRHVELVDHYKRLGEREYTGTFYRVVTEPDGATHKDPPFYSNYKWTAALDFNR